MFKYIDRSHEYTARLYVSMAHAYPILQDIQDKI